MARILVVGNLTLDIVNHLAHYPAEDSELRAEAQTRGPGGNAANRARVLTQLGHPVELAGVLAEDAGGRELADQMAAAGVGLRPSRRAPGHTPTSYVIHSRASGSRSIVHHRELPEYPAQAFTALELSDYAWVHFEGRNLEALDVMLADCRRRAPGLARSLELEKPRPGIETLIGERLGAGDVLLCGRHYARARGHTSAVDCLAALRRLTAADLVCAWGEAGAWSLPGGAGEAVHAPAWSPPRVVDTLAAGDTFNAGIIDARLRGLDWPDAVTAACRVAGVKCGRAGLDGLAAALDAAT